MLCRPSVILGCLALCVACGTPPASHPATAAPAAPAPAARRPRPASPPAPPPASPRASSASLPTAFRRRHRPTSAPPPTTPRVAGAHILIAFSGALRARPHVTRTRAAALALTRQIVRRLCPKPTWAQFAAAARKHSDGPTRTRGGFLGAWPPGRMVKPFEAAIAKLHYGECGGPVETRFGFHVVMRFDPAQMPRP